MFWLNFDEFTHILSLAASDWASTGTRASRGRTDVENKHFIGQKQSNIENNLMVNRGTIWQSYMQGAVPSMIFPVSSQPWSSWSAAFCARAAFVLLGSCTVRVRRPNTTLSFYSKYFISMEWWNHNFFALNSSNLDIIHIMLRISWLVQPLHSYQWRKGPFIFCLVTRIGQTCSDGPQTVRPKVFPS